MSIAASDIGLGAATGAKHTLDSLVPKTEHHYVVGALLLFVGLIGIAGSITGTLPSMIAGLFEPSALGSVTSSTGQSGDTVNPSAISSSTTASIGTPDTSTPAQNQNTNTNHVAK